VGSINDRDIIFKRKRDFKNMPQEVQETIEEVLKILDSEYKDNRNRYEDPGGYVVVLEKNRRL